MWRNLSYYQGLFLEELKKTTPISQNIRSPDRDLELCLTEQPSEMHPTNADVRKGRQADWVGCSAQLAQRNVYFICVLRYFSQTAGLVFITRIHKFSTKPGTTPKFLVPEGWPDANSTLRNHACGLDATGQLLFTRATWYPGLLLPWFEVTATFCFLSFIYSVRRSVTFMQPRRRAKEELII